MGRTCSFRQHADICRHVSRTAGNTVDYYLTSINALTEDGVVVSTRCLFPLLTSSGVVFVLTFRSSLCLFDLLGSRTRKYDGVAAFDARLVQTITDLTGTRVGPVAHGAGKVIFVLGSNKI